MAYLLGREARATGLNHRTMSTPEHADAAQPAAGMFKALHDVVVAKVEAGARQAHREEREAAQRDQPLQCFSVALCSVVQFVTKLTVDTTKLAFHNVPEDETHRHAAADPRDRDESHSDSDEEFYAFPD